MVRLAARARADLGPHPSPATVAAYADGILEHQEAELFCDHIALCNDCLSWYLGLRRWVNAPPDSGPFLSSSQVEADWLLLRQCLINAGILRKED